MSFAITPRNSWFFIRVIYLCLFSIFLFLFCLTFLEVGRCHWLMINWGLPSPRPRIWLCLLGGGGGLPAPTCLLPGSLSVLAGLQTLWLEEDLPLQHGAGPREGRHLGDGSLAGGWQRPREGKPASDAVSLTWMGAASPLCSPDTE